MQKRPQNVHKKLHSGGGSHPCSDSERLERLVSAVTYNCVDEDDEFYLLTHPHYKCHCAEELCVNVVKQVIVSGC